MGTFLMEQYKKKKAMESKQMQGLSKIGRILTDKVKDNFVSEIQVILYDKPILFDQSGSKVAQEVWNKYDPINIEDIVVKSDNMTESPIAKFQNLLELQVSQSKDMREWVAKFDMDGDLDEQVEKLRDEIMAHFFTKEFHTVAVENEQYKYWGTVNKFGKPDGIGRMIFTDNSVHEGSFKNGEPTGYGRRCDINGSVFSGTFEQGIRSGKGTFIDKSGL